MALFTRRLLQRVLHENAAFLTTRQLVTACKLLNSVRDEYLSTEWEQVILNAASKLGTVKHEPSLAGACTPDLWFEAANGSLKFIAEVTTASDRGLRKLNPVEALEEGFQRHRRKANIWTGGFNWRVDAKSDYVYRGKGRVRLKLPHPRDFEKTIFHAGFHEFLRRVKANPSAIHGFDVVSQDVGVHIIYDPASRGIDGGGHPSFTAANVISQNPVYNALKSKGDQLKATRYTGLTGIFLCDGGCDMLRSSGSNWAAYTVDEIIRYFFRQYRSISFVTTFVIRETIPIALRSQKRFIESRFYSNPSLKIDSAVLAQTIARICAYFPPIQSMPENALHELRRTNGEYGRYLGELQMGSNVRMSARQLLELLAGAMTVQEFEADYNLQHSQNPFHRNLEQGKLISKVTIDRQSDQDDDAVTFEFSEADPAVSTFRTEGKTP